MISKCHQQRARQLLADAIAALCETIVPYTEQLSVEGLLGITLDNHEVLLVNIQQSVNKERDSHAEKVVLLQHLEACLKEKLDGHQANIVRPYTREHTSFQNATKEMNSLERLYGVNESFDKTQGTLSESLPTTQSHRKESVVKGHATAVNLKTVAGSNCQFAEEDPGVRHNDDRCQRAHKEHNDCSHLGQQEASPAVVPNTHMSVFRGDKSPEVSDKTSSPPHRLQPSKPHEIVPISEADRLATGRSSSLVYPADVSTVCTPPPSLYRPSSTHNFDLRHRTSSESSLDLRVRTPSGGNSNPLPLQFPPSAQTPTLRGAVPMDDASTLLKEVYTTYNNISKMEPQDLSTNATNTERDREAASPGDAGMRLPLAMKTEELEEETVVVIEPEEPPSPQAEERSPENVSSPPTILKKPYSIAGKLRGSMKRKANLTPMHLTKQRRAEPVANGNDNVPSQVMLSSGEESSTHISVAPSVEDRKNSAHISHLEIDLTAEEEAVAHAKVHHQMSPQAASSAADHQMSPVANQTEETSSNKPESRPSISLEEQIRKLTERRLSNSDVEHLLPSLGNHGNPSHLVAPLDTAQLRAQVENQVRLLTTSQLLQPSLLHESRLLKNPATQPTTVTTSGQMPALTGIASHTPQDLAMFPQAHLFSSALQTLSQLTADNYSQPQPSSQMMPSSDQSGRSYQCSTCGKQMASQQGLLIHYRTHTGEKPHVCGFCGKGLSTSQGLQVHVRTHTGEKPFMCLFCGKGFNDKSNMKRHIKQCNTYGQRVT